MQARKPVSFRSAFVKLAVIALWLCIWQGAYLAVGESLLLPSPLGVGVRLFELVFTGSFWLIILSSIGKIMVGFVLGLLIGSLLGVATAFSEMLYQVVYLPMSIVKAAPVSSFIILAMIWISGRNLSLLIAALMVVPIAWSNMHQGIRSVDKNLLEMAEVFSFSKMTILRSIYIPSVLPFFVSAATVSMGLAWKAGVTGETLAAPKNFIGTQLYDAKVYLMTTDLFAWTGVIIILSIIIERLFVWLILRLANSFSARRGGSV